MTSTDLLAYGSGLVHEIDWADDGNYAHAASNVTGVAQLFRYGEGTNRRSNPQRPTADHGSGSVTLLGDDYVPGRSVVLTEAQLNARHRYRVRRGSTVLATSWIQEGRHRGGGRAGQETAFVLEGLLERQARVETMVSQTASSTTSTASGVLQLIKDAYGLSDSDFSQNLASTPLGLYSFDGSAGQYGSQFGLVSGGLPTARRAGSFGLFDPTRTPQSPLAVDSDNYVILDATTEFDQEQLWNAAVIEYAGGEQGFSQSSTATLAGQPSVDGNSIYTLTTGITIAEPPAGSVIEDIAGTVRITSGRLSLAGAVSATINGHQSTSENWQVTGGRVDNNRNLVLTVEGTPDPGQWIGNYSNALGSFQAVLSNVWSSTVASAELGVIQTRLVNVQLAIAASWTVNDTNTYTLRASNQDSIDSWGRRELSFRVWFASTAQVAMQARIDALAVPRNIHTIDLSLNQPTAQRNANVDALQGGDFIALDIRDDRTKTRIRGNAFVMHSEIVDNRNAVPYKRLICLEAPGTPAADTAPSKPAAPTLTVLSHSSLRATWAYPSSDGGVAVSSWTVRHRENGTSDAWTTTSISDGDDRRVEISGLSQSTEYEVQVRATNPIGDSPWSDSATATTSGAPARPSRPAAPTVTALSRQAIRATWTAPSANNSPITSYDVRYRTGSDAWTLVEDLTSTTTDISGLTASTSYSVQVRATNAIGDSDWSPSGTASTSAPGLPAAPDEPTIAVTHNSFTATWVAPDAGGGTIASYNLRYRTGGAAWATLTGITALTRTVSSLTVGATYDVQVAARNETGLGPYSDSAIAALHGVPEQPDPPRLQSAPIPAAGTNTRQITMQWTAPASDLAITSYSLRYRLSSTLHDWTTINSITATERQISALAANTTYEFQVRATSAAGNSPWSEDGNGTTATFVAPAAPARPTASAQSRTEIAVSWVAPTNNGGQAPTSYDLRYRTGSGTWTPITGVTSPHTITGLVQATAYQIQVRAINAGGTSAWSPSATATTNAPGVPGAPTSLAVAAVVPTGGANTRSLTATWGAPSDNGGFAITHYDLRYKLASGNSWTQENSVSSGAVISNLPVNTQYDVQVRAANQRGDSPWTTSVRRRTHGVIAPAAMAAPTITAVDPAHGAITRSLSAAFVEPTLHGGQNPTRYTVRYQAADADFWTTIPNAGTTSPYVQSGLAIGQAYDFQIAAVNSGGTGPWSPSGRGTTVGIHTPAAPAAPTLTVRDHDDILVEWTAPSATGGAAVTDYTLQWRIVASPANAWTTVASTGGTDTAYNLLSLTRVTEYEVRVAAINSAGTGPWSDSATATTEASEPGSPGILNIVQVTPAAGDETRGLTVTWLAPDDDGGSALTGYEVRYKLTTDADYTTLDAGLATSATISSLAVAMAYDISIRAVNAIGAGAWSPDSTGTTAAAVVPAAPSPRASAVEGTDDLVTEWSEPDDGGAPITRYRIRWTAAGSDSSTDGQLNNVQSPHTRTGLLPATEYSIQVGARNSVGWSEWSAVTRATTGDVADVWLREDGDEWLREDGGAWLLESNT